MKVRLSRPRLWLLAAPLAFAAGSIWAAWPGEGAGTRPRPGPAAGSQQGVQAAAPTPLRAAVDKAAAPQAPAAADPGLLVLPDGSAVPALNGARGAPPLARAWSPQVPYSPIVGTERNDLGVEWYVHADGTRSTTVMAFRPDLGRQDALTRVAHPGPAPPTPRR